MKSQMQHRVSRSRKVALLILPCVIIALCCGFFIYQKLQNSSDTDSVHTLSRAELEAGAKARLAPDFELPDAQGKLHRLKDFKGTLVILHFWATWCPPCLSEIPEWVELATAFKGRPVRLIAVSLDQSWSDALKILPSEKLPPPILSLLDSSGKLPDSYGTFQFPETYLIGADQKIKMKWVGPQNWGSPEIRNIIESQL